MEGDKLIIDCHSHILPRIDDGSQSVNESMELLNMERMIYIVHMSC